jgi:tetratricopeptide (TPR) repeat protein
MTQKDLGAAVNRTSGWVSQVERGVLPVERMSMLRALADALGVDVPDLRAEPGPEEPGPGPSAGQVNELEEVRVALTGHPVPGSLFGARRDVDTGSLRNRVDAVWELAHSARHAELSAMMPELLIDLEAAVRSADEPDRPALYQDLSRAYQAASAAFARQGEADAAWVAADRSIRAAESAGLPLWVLAGHFRMTHAFLRLQRFDQAERAVIQALATLENTAEPPSTDPEVLSLYGALHLAAALLRAREGNRAAAREHLDAAEHAAARIGTDRDDFGTEFGPTNVLLHRVSIAADLGDAGEALEIAARVTPENLSPERQARYWLDVARCHAQRRHADEATQALLNAESLSPELVRAHHLARQTLSDLIRLSGKHRPQELAELADRIGTSS